MVNLTIDGLEVCVPEGTTIMKAAARAGIEIPHLCYLEGINEISACKVCVVELLGKVKLITACNNKVEEGMVIFTNSPKVRSARRMNVELILSQHDCRCATCVRSGNCSLQKLSNDLGIVEVPYRQELPEQSWDMEFPLIRDFGKCIKCMRCVQICEKVQQIFVWDVQNTGSRTTVDVSQNRSIRESGCTLCGQCITHCPTGALRERNDVQKVFEALADPEKITVVQAAPAVRAAWGEQLGLSREEATERRMAAVLRRIGFDYVFDTNFAADLTIMEEGNELLKRLAEPAKHRWPMFTSCCPAWVSFVRTEYPEFAAQLSTAKSPQQMFGAVAKSYFAREKGIAPENVCCISVMPCVAKKGEAALDSMKNAEGLADVDLVLTTREFVRMIRAEHINPRMLPEEDFDRLLGTSSGAGVIFGVTGGVMEAALRTAYAAAEGKNPPAEAFAPVRGSQGRREASFALGGRTLRTCTVSGLGNARALLEDLRSQKVSYDFVEVMSCPGGCVGGGGQPICDGQEPAAGRGEQLYRLDRERQLRFSHENPEVQALYRDFLGEPLGHKAHELLHTEICSLQKH
ncbi:MAG: [FeFe] hydrogenase, group A [Eubacteriales bacterium]|nr:[FeFe] hydrogenase, group A [Eubacteriales bacterium]